MLKTILITTLLVLRLQAELVDLSHTLDENARNWPIKGYKRYNHSTLVECRWILFFCFSDDENGDRTLRLFKLG